MASSPGRFMRLNLDQAAPRNPEECRTPLGRATGVPVANARIRLQRRPFSCRGDVEPWHFLPPVHDEAANGSRGGLVGALSILSGFAAGALSSDVSASERLRSNDSDPSLEAGGSSRGGLDPSGVSFERCAATL
jgi:hypothetical protein